MSDYEKAIEKNKRRVIINVISSTLCGSTAYELMQNKNLLADLFIVLIALFIAFTDQAIQEIVKDSYELGKQERGQHETQS